ncbi:MAG: metallophosphoesterase family protein [Phycisphaerales bacterium]|jgi:predicted phosphodiesterase|nr:metallophosphoesterase family protein [Phycisphaerales bacterium]
MAKTPSPLAKNSKPSLSNSLDINNFGRILVLSDLHLCKRLSTIDDVDQLRPLWQGVDTLILNGDTEESYSKKYAKDSQAKTKELLALASSDGVDVVFLNGNHDPMISDNHAIKIHNDSILIMHGHAVFPEVAPWTWYAKKIIAHRKQVLAELGNSYEAQLHSTQIVSDRSAKSRAIKNRPSLLGIPYRTVWCIIKILHTWHRFSRITDAWVSQYSPKSKFVVVGHTHHAGIWETKNRVIINTGCFGFPSHPRGILIEQNTLQVYRIKKQQNEYVLHQLLDSWDFDER